MKYALSLLSMAAGLFLLTGCSEKFKVAAPYKNITVVYGLIDRADTAHYVRIQKAFLDNDKSSVSMSQTPDSSFYARLNVRIDRYIPTTGTPVIYDSIHLTRVDLNTEGYPKEQGAFFTAPNYAYKFKNTLDPNYIYRLVITNLATGEVDSAEAPIIDNSAGTFVAHPLDDTSISLRQLDFNTGSANRTLTLNNDYYNSSAFTFQGRSTPVGIAQVIIRFNWVDSNFVTHEKSAHSYDLNAGYMHTDDGKTKFQITHLTMFTALANGMGAAPANTIRLLNLCDIYYYLSTQDFYVYQTVASTQGTGLTGSEIEPTYTNIKGANALGLFTSRTMHSSSLPVNDKTLTALMASSMFAQTNLKGRAY